MEIEKLQAGALRTKIRMQHKVMTGIGAHKVTAWVDLDGTPAESPPKAYTRC